MSVLKSFIWENLYLEQVLESEKKLPHTKISKKVFAIGGSDLSNSSDAMIYLIKCHNEKLALIDCGVDSLAAIENNIKELGLNPDDLIALILTHCHIDHTGTASQLVNKYKDIKTYAHEWEREAIEGKGNYEKLTAASWYGVSYEPVNVDVAIKAEEEKHKIGETEFLFIHTPGHTPGSMSVLIEDDGRKILFGQDIHGPFMDDFNSSVRDWAASMKKLISKEADVLAEGHYGIFYGKDDVKDFIKRHLRQQRML